MKPLKRTALAMVFTASLCATGQAQVIYIDDAGQKADDIAARMKSDQPAQTTLAPVPVQNVRLLNSLFTERYALNRQYMMSLENHKLLQNFYNEAGIEKTGHGILGKEGNYQDFYWGWESPGNQLRGHFLGHWLSAAAYMYAETGDEAVKQKADQIVSELAVCQQHNGGEWVGSIPEKYLDLMADGQPIWSPQYTLHKTLMGLYDMYALAGSKQALDVLDKFADWFHRWTDRMIAEGKADAIYKGETSGMLEIWANMYGLTHKQKYLDLMERYGAPGLFGELMAGHDALSCDHANASVPWSHGAARTYEVTGNTYWRDVTLAFWRNAVQERESFCTGGQNAGEFWIPPHELAHFAGENNQEHCTVYNMMRTADYLFRWTGDPQYADYIERNLYNGILAQQHPHTGMVAYFLPIAAGYHKGGEKGWGHPTMDFYCCHGSLVQAQTRYPAFIYYQSDKGLTLSQYIPSELKWQYEGTGITLRQDFAAHQFDRNYKDNRWKMKIHVKTDKAVRFDLQLRLPWWLKQKAVVRVNGEDCPVKELHGWLTLSRTWQDDNICVEFPTEVYTEPMPERTDMVAYMEGPLVLAGLTDGEVTLETDNLARPQDLLVPEYGQEYKTIRWTQSHYRTTGQSRNIRLVPLYEIGDESYEIYFPLRKRANGR